MGLGNMKARLNYLGGGTSQERMIKSKEKSLKRALSNSYQAATTKLSDGREFKCLINPDKISMDEDKKFLSIPFRDMCLTTKEIEDIGVKEGDVICWKENGTYWLVYLRRLEELAYFRADLLRCRNQIQLDNGTSYWVYIKGPSEKALSWDKASNSMFNKMNNSLVMMITADEDTIDYFNRFKIVYIQGKPWEVQVVDNISTPGIIEVSLKETFSNTIETNIDLAVEQSKDVVEEVEQEGAYIAGPLEIYPYDVVEYTVKNAAAAGSWRIENASKKNLVELAPNGESVTVKVLTGKSGSFTLVYDTIAADIKIKSL